ncbi:MAG: DUF3795 domain-containing protein [Spirochaetota bacterium]
MKKHPTIGCCGIQCGLCPRYHTKGPSRCPGCFGKSFHLKHPSCSIVTCCVKSNGYETCGDCSDLPCKKLASWDTADSFVTHQNTLTNLKSIAKNGVKSHVHELRKRMRILEELLHRYDDGRSKSFYCLAANLLPLEALRNVMAGCAAYVKSEKTKNKKDAAAAARRLFQERALEDNIVLRYRTGK